LEHKKSGQPGVYALFTADEDESAWRETLHNLRTHLHEINDTLFDDRALRLEANAFIDQRLTDAEGVLDNLQALC
ncbi:MAG: aspartate kinase, partial [Anaerolineae bacterium]|nr:aspartate kinase [Anaerolineae bacterium]